MKITNIVTFALEQNLEKKDQFAFSQTWCEKRTVLICKIETDDGYIGWGESFGPAIIHKTIIDKYYKPFLIGKDPLDTQVIWDFLYNISRDSGQKGVMIQALSSIDIALWDLKGKIFDVPLYKLIGGSPRKRIKPYATGMYRKYTEKEIEETCLEAVSYVERGFKAIKIKIGFGIDYDIKLVTKIRNMVGFDIEIMADANHAYNSMNAIKVGKALAELGIKWFEEPVPPEDIDGYKEVRSKVEIPIAGGEAEYTRYGMQSLLSNRCVDILQPDCTITGGISEFIKICTLCSIANIQCYPHIWGSGIALATGIHMAFALPDFPSSLEPDDVFLEYDQTENIFRRELAIGLPQVNEGWLGVPEGPGLGVEVNEDLLEFYAVT